MSNTPVKIVQSLARHSTPTLTLGVYAHVGLYDQSAALDALPDLTRPAQLPRLSPRPGRTGRLATDNRPIGSARPRRTPEIQGRKGNP